MASHNDVEVFTPSRDREDQHEYHQVMHWYQRHTFQRSRSAASENTIQVILPTLIAFFKVSTFSDLRILTEKTRCGSSPRTQQRRSSILDILFAVKISVAGMKQGYLDMSPLWVLRGTDSIDKTHPLKPFIANIILTCYSHPRNLQIHQVKARARKYK